jgi:putative ABC transport system permease protein
LLANFELPIYYPTLIMLKNKHRPLAWAQLSHQKIRLSVAIGGIAFANILIFMQLGFLTLFSKGATALPENLTGDLFIINPESTFIGANNFDRIRLYQAAAFEGVVATTPLYLNFVPWAYSSKFTSFQTRILAFNPQISIFNNIEINRQVDKIHAPGVVLFDRLSKAELGPIADKFRTSGAVRSIVNNRRVEVAGLFSMGNSFFAGDGNILMSEDSYADIFGENALNNVTIGIVRVAPQTDLPRLKAGMKVAIPGIEVLTRRELIQREIDFQNAQPTGPIFGFGAMMGFVVGIVVVYQVLYADVSDHLAEYATLKAIGHSDWALLRVIFTEAIILAVIGFVPGCGLSIGMYIFLAQATKLELLMTPDIALMVFVLTLVMCMASAAIASGKLRSADPADVF